MPRILILCERPPGLSADEAERWLRRDAAQVRDRGIERFEIERLGPTPQLDAHGFVWLLEITVRTEDDVERLFRQPRFLELLGDLRLTGMKPAAAIAPDRANRHSV